MNRVVSGLGHGTTKYLTRFNPFKSPSGHPSIRNSLPSITLPLLSRPAPSHLPRRPFPSLAGERWRCACGLGRLERGSGAHAGAAGEQRRRRTPTCSLGSLGRRARGLVRSARHGQTSIMSCLGRRTGTQWPHSTA